MAFQQGFLWGGVTAANQCEGGFEEGGRGLANVDLCPAGENRLSVIRGKNVSLQFENGVKYPVKEGIDHYHHVEKDIRLFGEMGFKVYRFSIAWTRIFPNGDEETPCEEGLKFYEKIVTECEKYQIEPLVTISHFDCPVGLIKKYGGWKNRQMISDYLKLCKVLFERFRGRVRYWLTFNEINMILHAPFMGAVLYFEDGENEEQQKYQAAHHELIASALAVEMAHKMDENNLVGCMFAAGSTYPHTCNPEDVWAAKKIEQEEYLFVDVQVRGYYPNYGKKRLVNKGCFPKMETDDEIILKNGTVDFVSFSYYNSRCIAKNMEKDKAEGNLFATVKNPYLKESEWGWPIDPLGFRITLNEVYARYQKPLFVVENGLGAVDKLEENGEIEDDYRIDYLRSHIQAMYDAVTEDGVELLGYTTWAPIDSVSASSGEMKKRYGFHM